jgi:ribonuclease HII
MIGVDEVGRGAWAGPVCVGAVMLCEPIAGLKDSKLLNADQRVKLALEIKSHSVLASLGWSSHMEIDRWGLTHAMRIAIQRALKPFSAINETIILDGAFNFVPDDPRVRILIDADMHEPSVSAASVLAKVARDSYMAIIARRHPQYGFERHVGYGTKLHVEAIKSNGVSAIHRLSYKPVSAWA